MRAALLIVPLLLHVLALPSVGRDAPDVEFAERLTPLEGTRPAQWRIVWTRDPAHEATVSWTTADAGNEHRVLYAPGARGADGDAYASRQDTHRDGRYSRHARDKTPAAHYHHARLTGLEPSTTYRLRLESDGQRSPELTFTTAPADERPFAILVGGDSRSGWRVRCFLNAGIARICAEDPSVLALSHGGDFVMYGQRWDEWSRWLSHHELTTTEAGRVLPIVPTRGNHDFGTAFDEVFDDAGGAGRNHYRTRLSPLASLITLNSNISVAGDQLTWLDTELAAAREDSRWVMVSYHRALYPAVKSPGEALSFWPPLFDRHGVDLVFESDGHCIKRTPRIRGDRPHPEGVIYLGEGGLGVPQRRPRTDLWYLQPPGIVTQGHHVVRVDVAPDSLRARILRMPDPPARLAAENFRQVVPPGGEWRYLAGDEAPEGWTDPGFDDSAWPVGRAGFGFGDDDDATVLDDMRGNYRRVHLRIAFDAPEVADGTALQLMCRFDDAFIAYLNGVEVARAGVEPPRKPGRKPKLSSHEASRIEAFPIAGGREHLRPERNVLALVGYNRMLADHDFTLDPWLAADRLVEPADSASPLVAIDDVSLDPRPR